MSRAKMPLVNLHSALLLSVKERSHFRKIFDSLIMFSCSTSPWGLTLLNYLYFFQILILQRLSQWVLTEFNISPLTLSHWPVKETLLSGEWEGWHLTTTSLPVHTGGQWRDQHVMLTGCSAVIQFTGVSLDQYSATQSTSLDRVSEIIFY